MKLCFLTVVALLFSARAVPSKEAVHDTHAYSVKDGLADDSFVGEIKERSFGTHDGFDLDSEIELVSDDSEQPFKDFSDDDDDFYEYEDVVPEEVRISGQSVETEDVNEDKHDEGANENNDDTEKDGSSRELRNDYHESKSVREPEGFEDGFEMDAEDIKDVTVHGQSEYSYFVGDKLHGLNEMKAISAMKGMDKHLFDAEKQGLFEAVDDGVGQEEEMSYRELYEEGHIEEEGMEDLNNGYDHGYSHMDKLKVKGQAIEYENEDELEYEDYDEGDEAVRYADEPWHDDDDDDDDDDDFEEDDEMDVDMRSADVDEGDGFEGDDFEEDDEDYWVRKEGAKKASAGRRVKGMSVKELDDEDEEFDDETGDDMDEIERQDSDDDDYDDYDDYVDEAVRLRDDKGWDEDEYGDEGEVDEA